MSSFLVDINRLYKENTNLRIKNDCATWNVYWFKSVLIVLAIAIWIVSLLQCSLHYHEIICKLWLHYKLNKKGWWKVSAGKGIHCTSLETWIHSPKCISGEKDKLSTFSYKTCRKPAVHTCLLSHTETQWWW